MLGLAALLAVAVGGVLALLRAVEVDLPYSAGCTASDGERSSTLDPEQAANAALIAGLATERGLPARAVTIALATAMQESRLENIDYGDRDSVGLFQQRPSQGWGSVEEIMDPVYSTNTFYDALVEVEGYEDMEITVAAQTVQRSGFPDAYAQHEPMARLFASALTGYSDAAISCRLHEGSESIPLTELLARDLASAVAEPTDDGVTLTLGDGVTGDAERSVWVLAHWAVATAELTGVTEIDVGDLRWSREDGSEASWAPLETPAPDGVVVVR